MNKKPIKELSDDLLVAWEAVVRAEIERSRAERAVFDARQRIDRLQSELLSYKE